MAELLQRLRQRKLVQWTLAYLAGAWVLLQVLGLAADSYDWPHAIMRVAFGVIALGFVVTLVLAWYHGERGAQKVGGTELLLIALVLVIGGGLLWRFGTAPSSMGSPGSAQRNSGNAARETALGAASSGVQVAATAQAVSIQAKSIAVLPFENLSADKDNAYFAGGMQDMILTRLANIGDLKVISRRSTVDLPSHPSNLKSIARQLGVATILEGSVQKSGNEVLINVQLIDAATADHLWANAYKRMLDDVFDVEGEVATNVAEALQARLSAAESRKVSRIPTKNPEAYTLYLKALHEFDTSLAGGFEVRSMQAAAAYLQQAIQLDPNFAEAYAELSHAQGNLVLDESAASDAMRRAALVNARKALALQPDLVRGYASLAAANLLEHRPDEAIVNLKTAQRLAPNDAGAALLLSLAYVSQGQWQPASLAVAQARRFDPRYTPVYVFTALIDQSLRRYDEAQRALNQGLALMPENQTLQLYLARSLLLAGQATEALRVLDKVQAATGKRGDVWQAHMLLRQYSEARTAAMQGPPPTDGLQAGRAALHLGQAEAALGHAASARAAFQRAHAEVDAALHRHPQVAMLHDTRARIEMCRGNRVAALADVEKAISTRAFNDYFGGSGYLETKAEVLAHFGDATGATRVLEQLLATEGTGLAMTPQLLNLDPAWDPIRKDPHFRALLAAMVHRQAATPASAARDAGVAALP